MKLPKHLIILFLFIYVNSKAVNADRDLYKDTDDVLRLKSDTFKSTVFDDNKNVTFVVQFYNTFCGHCQMFAPVYRELATRVKNWTSVVRVAGIDCSKDENVPTCRESGIEGYPTIFIYPPKAHFNDKNDPPLNLRSHGVEWTIDDIEETIIEYVGNLTTRGEGHPIVADAMQPITVTGLDKITRIYPANSGPDAVNDFAKEQDLMLIVESDKSFLGRRLIIEYFRIHPKLELRRVLLSNKVLLKTIMTNEEYLKLENNQPLLLRISNLESNMRAQVLVRGEANHILPTFEEAERQDFILNRFKMFFEHYYHEELKEIGGFKTDSQNVATTQRPMTLDVSHKTQNNELEIHYLVHNDPKSSKRIFAVDLLKGISYMITHEIRIKGNLTPNEFNTVRNLLTIFKKYLPLDKWDATLSKFILDLRTSLDANRAIYEKDGITAQQMNDLLEFSGAYSVRMRYNRENWMSCADSDRQNKGYTCSLWLLFHSLTVGEYTKAAPVRFRPTLVLTTMRDYITKFLGCTVCSSNFARETEGLEASLTQRNSSVMWLWKTHNYVNQRLNNEKQEKHKRPLVDVIYPKHGRCPECYKTDVNAIGTDGRTLDDVEWNLFSVFDTMVGTYSPDKVISPVELASMFSSIRGKVNYEMINSDGQPGSITRPDMNSSIAEEWNIQSIFSVGDMSICLFLYFCCIVIVAIVCFSLNFRFKRPNCKSK